MASSSVSVSDVEHDFALASRRAKVRSARANRAVNSSAPSRAPEDNEKDGDAAEGSTSKAEQASAVLLESNDASPKPVSRGLSKDKRSIIRNQHAGKSNKGNRDRRKLREKRKSTGVMHLPSTESTGGSTGEDENNENSQPANLGAPAIKPPCSSSSTVEPEKEGCTHRGRSDSDLDADDEANNSGDVAGKQQDSHTLKAENERLTNLVVSKEKRIAALEIQIAQLTRQMSELREENSKLVRAFSTQS